RPFHVMGGEHVDVPTMTGTRHVGYAKRGGFSIVTIPYRGLDIQFLILLPDQVNGLAALEGKLTAGLLSECANLSGQEVILFLPKFRLEPPLMTLGKQLQALGMRTAFDQPRGSAVVHPAQNCYGRRVSTADVGGPPLRRQQST